MPVPQFNEHLHCPCKSPTIPPTCFSYVFSTYPNKLNEQINKREILSKVKIEQMTRDANLSIKQHITLISVEAAVTLLEKKLNQNEKQNLINQSIKELESVIKN